MNRPSTKLKQRLNRSVHLQRWSGETLQRFVLPLLLVVKLSAFENHPGVVFTFGPIFQNIFPKHFQE